MSQAITYAQIHDVETPFEATAKAALAAMGVTALTSRELTSLPGTRVDIQLRLGEAQGYMSQMGSVAGVPYFTPGAWHGLFEFQIVTPRTTPDPRAHAFMRACVRQLMAPQMHGAVILYPPFESLPFHNLANATVAGTVPHIEAGSDEDASMISWNVVIGIRNGAWPPMPQ